MASYVEHNVRSAVLFCFFSARGVTTWSTGCILWISYFDGVLSGHYYNSRNRLHISFRANEGWQYALKKFVASEN